MLTDAGAIALSLVAARLAARPAGGPMTYGLGRGGDPLGPGQRGDAARARAADRLRGRAPPRRPAGRGRGCRCSPSRSRASGSTSPPWACSRRANRASLNVEGSFQHLLTDLYAFIGTAIAGGRDPGHGLRPRGRDRLARRRRAHAPLGLRAAEGVGAGLPGGGAGGRRPRRDRPGAGRPAGRGRGPRPARLGGDVGVPGPVGARGRRRRRPTATPRGPRWRKCCASASASSTRPSRSSTGRRPSC